ncbi:hypothetical protein BD311DRAFT_659279 [Dichomitus squalens]|uniref:DUF302 domain-containing protein n=2 Tax=Dichomitus squalens TaxID=114155 RepID=A0A4Q9MS52_9APHY|nr:hypothetical protein BD311DRAFT_659279 [Dichomitus squalens]TBU57933.1 hypothetical protein BD310DRAFT_820648 [Dichomitus squalens]
MEFTSRRITYDTPLPIAEVIARLDKEVNKAGGGPEVTRLLSTAKTRAELESGMDNLVGDRNFVYFAGMAYHNWLNAYHGTADTPQTYAYIFGNPLIAQTMLKYDLNVALHVPLKIVIVERLDGSGTRVAYDDPASVIAVPKASGLGLDPELTKAAEALSQKLETLIQTITRAD